MGLSLGGLTSLATFGLVDDPFGTDAAAKAAREGNASAMAAEKEMFDKSMAFQRGQWDWQKEQAKPWTQAGLGALGQYQDTMGAGFNFDPSTDPVYGARVSELDKNLASSQSARGMKLSGSTLKGLRDITASELGASYGRQFDQYQSRLNNLANIINVGTGSSMNLSNIGQNYGANISNMMQNFGQSQAQGYMNIGQIGAQQAVAPFQNLMSLGTTAGGVMSGIGAFKGGGSPSPQMPSWGFGNWT